MGLGANSRSMVKMMAVQSHFSEKSLEHGTWVSTEFSGGSVDNVIILVLLTLFFIEI